MDTVLTALVQLVDFVKGIDPHIWAMAGSVFVISGAQEALKHKVNTEERKLDDKTNLLIAGALSVVVTCGDALMTSLQANPQVLGVHSAVYLASLSAAYTFVVKPISVKLRETLEASRQWKAMNATPAATVAPEADQPEVLSV
jgi:ABC-type Fe3+-siderophore transport system permease subunit